MGVGVEEVRNIFRALNLRYEDTAEDDEGWKASFWMPIEKYQFDGREGLNTRITLSEKNESGTYDFLRMVVGGVYESTDMNLLNLARNRVNMINLDWKIVKWFWTTGTNKEDIASWRVHVVVEISVDGEGTISSNQFWRSHAAIWHSIMESWDNFSVDLGLSPSKQNIDTGQEIPENIEDIDKEEMIRLFDRFLDEKFDNV